MPLECALYYSNGIKGANTKKGRVDSSAVIEFNHEVYTPRDTQRGVATGARVHGTVDLVKEIDTATPSLYQALCTAQLLDELRVEWFRINSMGQEELYFTHTISGVRVTAVEGYLPNTKDPAKERQTHLEKWHFSYEKINWRHEEGFEFEDMWAEAYA
jgi:type VI secretion system secreted protein Hcp